ncbi:hypothetical protein Tc00.1047053511277.150 [Trypanosoma cruzi]|uniref:Uncharacterized protein n=1 Tax=Trypanosoma cruzi (strain CL Brener) TaxID=353153 RepID=Q4E5H9_TRYCC|nr:hypothetical protein Tc00.1047053511277.150 [Trypanosoma cruzi]EAO00032.1 hypothetical protein Tc00.1047053511277.150 [Trypanosoma cruzi]|eukprot:XP_821883.1 hypothetical protein [Trypanosoma cruzi strain CL Brener]
MCFAPPRRRRTGITAATSSFSRRLPGNMPGPPSVSPFRRRATSSYHAPPREVVEEQTRRYAEDIRRRQPPPAGISIPASHSPRRDSKGGKKITPAKELGGLHSLRGRVRVKEQNGDALRSSSRDAGKTLMEASRGQWTHGQLDTPALPFPSNDAVLPNQRSYYSDMNHDLYYQHQKKRRQRLSGLHRRSDASFRMGDEVGEEYVSNPYIRSVLQGSEQRWNSPSLFHASFSHQSRSQSLDQYYTAASPYLSRHDLMREQKRVIHRSPNNGNLPAFVENVGTDDADKSNGVKKEIERIYNIDSAGGGNELNSTSLQLTHLPASAFPLSLSEKSEMNSRAGHSGEACSEYMQPLCKKPGMDEIAVTLPHRATEEAAVESEASDANKVNLAFLYSSIDEDPRAYLYASPTGSATPSMGKRHCRSAPMGLGTTSLVAEDQQEDSASFSHCCDDANRVQEARLTLKHGAKPNLKEPDDILLRQRQMDSVKEQKSVGSRLFRPCNSDAANYLVTQETEIVDASGTVWVAKLAARKE